jgi:hypothetical protein
MKTALERRRQRLRKQLTLVERRIVRTKQHLRQLEAQMAQATPGHAKVAWIWGRRVAAPLVDSAATLGQCIGRTSHNEPRHFFPPFPATRRTENPLRLVRVPEWLDFAASALRTDARKVLIAASKGRDRYFLIQRVADEVRHSSGFRYKHVSSVKNQVAYASAVRRNWTLYRKSPRCFDWKPPALIIPVLISVIVHQPVQCLAVIREEPIDDVAMGLSQVGSMLICLFHSRERGQRSKHTAITR